MGILNNNDYTRGFADGKKDAEAGKDPNYIRMGLSLKYVIYGSPSLESYTRGYNDGFKEAMRKSIIQKVEVVNTSTDKESTNSSTITRSSSTITRNRVINHHTSSVNMSRSQSLELQIEALEKLESLLLRTTENLRSVMQQYLDGANAILEEGLPEEFFDEFNENFIEPASRSLTRLVDEMEDTDLKRIQGTKSALEDIIFSL